MTPKSTKVRAVLDLRDIPPSAYALPTDGRKKRNLCEHRRSLVNQMATHANPDGTNITVSKATLASALGWSQRTVQYLLNDLKALGLLNEHGWHPEHKTRIRSLNIEVIRGKAPEQDSNSPEQDSSSPEQNRKSPEQNSQAPEQDSTSPRQDSIAYNRLITVFKTEKTKTEVVTEGESPEKENFVFENSGQDEHNTGSTDDPGQSTSGTEGFEKQRGAASVLRDRHNDGLPEGWERINGRIQRVRREATQ